MERVPNRVQDRWSAVILILLMLVSSQRLYSTSWAPGLGTVLLLSLLGSILGLILGLSKFKRLAVFLLSMGYSIVLLPLVMGWILYKNIPWMERMVSLGGQLAFSTVQLFSSQPVQDSTLFVTFAAVVYWIVTLRAGYTLTRYGGFAEAIAPAGVILVIVQLFDMQYEDRFYILAIYAFLCLLLLGRLNYVRNRQLWMKKRVWVSAESVTDMNLIISVAALALVVLVWVAPSSGRPVTSARIMWEDLTRPLRQRQQDLNRTIQSLRGSQVRTLEFYGNTLNLGQQAATGENTYLRIRAPLVNGAERYYWRVRTYDLYQNDQWYTDYAFDEPFTPDQSSLALADPEGMTAEFVFTIPDQNLNLLATPPRPIWISRSTQLTFTPSADGSIDPLMFVANPTLMAGEVYTVHANIYQPTVVQLRNAGVNYPAWVSDHYLELPPDLPPEIGTLARKITAGFESPYDKAAAITEYLRTNITYSTSVGTPPKGRDTLVWFLFDTKTGFCNYYATAEVVLLRSIGIPARMAVGFAQGEYEPPNMYTVRQLDSHAWPEVYFPGNGWEEFEPTTNQLPFIRPAGENSSNGEVPNPTPQGIPQVNNTHPTPVPLGEGTGPSNRGSQNILLRLTLIFVILLVLIIAGIVGYFFGFFDKLIASGRQAFQSPLPVVLMNSLENLALTPPGWLARWAYLTGLTPAERFFAVVYQGLRWLGVGTSAAQTPAEAAAALTGYIPNASIEIHSLLEQCEHSLYSQTPADLDVARRAADTIRRVSLRAAIQARWRAFRVILRQGFRQKKHPDEP